MNMQILVIVAASALSTGCDDGSDLSREEIFDTVWQTVNDGFFDPTFGGVDWKAVGDRCRPKVVGADSDEQFYRQLNAMLYELKVSHLGVIPKDHPEWIGAPSAFSDGGVGMEARIIDGKAVVTSVRAGSVAQEAGLRPGYTIETVNGKTLADLKREVLESEPIAPLNRRTLFTQKLFQQFYGKPGSEVTVVCVDGKKQRVKKTLKREPRPGRALFMEGVPPVYIEFEEKRLKGNIGYIRFNMFHPAVVDRLLGAVDKMRGAAGLVIDIRGNAGGAFGVRKALAERMMSKRRLCWTYRGRRGDDPIYLDPPAKPYTGPLAILSDALSSSAAEEFPGAMQALGRAAIVGERTPGIVLVAEVLPLANGDTLIYPVAQTILSDGTVLEGRGVIPDIEVQHTVKALLEGRDLQLEAAIRYLREQAKSSP